MLAKYELQMNLRRYYIVQKIGHVSGSYGLSDDLNMIALPRRADHRSMVTAVCFMADLLQNLSTTTRDCKAGAFSVNG